MQAALSQRTQSQTVPSANEAATATPVTTLSGVAPDGEFTTPDGSRAELKDTITESPKPDRVPTETSPYGSARGSITASLPRTSSIGASQDQYAGKDASKLISVAVSDSDFHSFASPAMSPRSGASKALGDAPAVGKQAKVDESISEQFQYVGSGPPTQHLEQWLEDGASAGVTSAGPTRPLSFTSACPYSCTGASREGSTSLYSPFYMLATSDAMHHRDVELIILQLQLSSY